LNLEMKTLHTPRCLEKDNLANFNFDKDMGVKIYKKVNLNVKGKVRNITNIGARQKTPLVRNSSLKAATSRNSSNKKPLQTIHTTAYSPKGNKNKVTRFINCKNDVNAINATSNKINKKLSVSQRIEPLTSVGNKKSTKLTIVEKSISLTPNRKELLTDNQFVTQVKSNPKSTTSVIEKFFGQNMEKYDDDYFAKINNDDKQLIMKSFLCCIYDQKKRIAEMENNMNANYKNVISKHEEKISFLIKELSTIKESISEKANNLASSNLQKAMNHQIPKAKPSTTRAKLKSITPDKKVLAK